MPGPIFLSVLSGASVSSAFVLTPMGRAWALHVPSMTGNVVRVDFAITSGGTATSFGTYYPEPLTDAVVTSSSQRPAFAVILQPPSPWGRLRVGPPALTDVATFVLLPIAQ
jgi:hypothetical protein